MPINSKKKGSRGERDLCKWWKEWTGYEFSRVPASGGLRWKKADNITSDIICTDDAHAHKFKFSIECKNYKGITFNDIIKGTKSDVLKFWLQACSDATRGKKIPLLFMRENGMAKGVYFVATTVEVGKLLLQLNLLEKDYFRIHAGKEGMDFYVFNSKDLRAISYSIFYKKIRKLVK